MCTLKEPVSGTSIFDGESEFLKLLMRKEFFLSLAQREGSRFIYIGVNDVSGETTIFGRATQSRLQSQETMSLAGLLLCEFLLKMLVAGI